MFAVALTFEMGIVGTLDQNIQMLSLRFDMNSVASNSDAGALLMMVGW
jgi:hypothetical protein